MNNFTIKRIGFENKGSINVDNREKNVYRAHTTYTTLHRLIYLHTDEVLELIPVQEAAEWVTR